MHPALKTSFRSFKFTSRYCFTSSVVVNKFGSATPARGFQNGVLQESSEASNTQLGSAPPRILVTGASGQIGADLIPILKSRFGSNSIIAADVRNYPGQRGTPIVYCDVQDKSSITRAVVEGGVSVVVHLASILSANGERDPTVALAVNLKGSQNILDVARDHGLKVFIPSTIAVFGPTTPKDWTPDRTVTEPSTVYGITKVHMELMGGYYHQKYGVDFRSLRYPGIVSSSTAPGGGTTDYAVAMFHEALKHGKYDCYLKENTLLPMMYMPDCLKATVDLLEAPRQALTRCVYNVGSMSFSPSELASTLRAELPGQSFNVEYKPDFRQEIADSWPYTIDDSLARRDWGWRPDFDIKAMTNDMLDILKPQYEAPLKDLLNENSLADFSGSPKAYKMSVKIRPSEKSRKLVISPCC
mmetsp:Transcript_35252/g.48937  ORF Transcript_35252/g.48937 Transcript_35252/m.48937 type:complete len:414 (+) Transcript_35252:164-1405(+)|eukprot:CAMPEP_0196587716 /NCGR_PEP_ID=MMETSP1081-20130531/58385_1 /TAXON_ID=36882 /ORGANISM="Pyramimonas amylifera, Strain CCMP720" /LENGTH=413 /DNA_ID=CAMNT_0041909981 /DNA_START=158 /DNA_END=1399 /DNA_ORIENTATION=+